MSIRNVSSENYRFGNLEGLKTLVLREVGRFTSVYLQTIVAPVITTLLFYAIFALAFGGIGRDMAGVPFLDFLAPGLIMMTMVQNSFANSSSSIVIAKIQGNIVDVFMPPLSALEIFFGYVLGSLLRGLAVGFACFLAMRIFIAIPLTSLPVIVLFAVLGNFMLGSIGIMAGIWADKFDHIAAVTNFVITPLAFLSGTFYAMSSLPEFWQFLAAFNPFYYMIDGFRQGFIGVGDTEMWLGLGVLGVIDVVLAVGAYMMLATGYKIKS